MVRSITAIWLTLGFVAGATWGSNIYSVSYDGDALPEEQPGWYRTHGIPWAIRTIETDPDDPNNHFLVINSLADQMVYDYAWYPRHMDPDQGEFFYAEFKLLVVERHGPASDVAVDFNADHGNIVGLNFGCDYVQDTNDFWSTPVAPGVFHTYRLESPDMLTYMLWIDGQFARQAPFFEGAGTGYAAFGDEGHGGQIRSLAKWDFVRFGVATVPEAGSQMLALAMCLYAGLRRR